MPLINAIKRWIGRRTEVSEPYVPVQQMSSGSDGGVIWMVVVIVATPILAFLTLTGLAYEGVIRVDRERRLGILDWVLAAAIAAVVVVVLIAVVLNVIRR